MFKAVLDFARLMRPLLLQHSYILANLNATLNVSRLTLWQNRRRNTLLGGSRVLYVVFHLAPFAFNLLQFI